MKKSTMVNHPKALWTALGMRMEI